MDLFWYCEGDAIRQIQMEKIESIAALKDSQSQNKAKLQLEQLKILKFTTLIDVDREELEGIETAIIAVIPQIVKVFEVKVVIIKVR